MGKYYKIGVEETRAIKIKANAGLLVEQEGIQGYAMMWNIQLLGYRHGVKAILIGQGIFFVNKCFIRRPKLHGYALNPIALLL